MLSFGWRKRNTGLIIAEVKKEIDEKLKFPKTDIETITKKYNGITGGIYSLLRDRKHPHSKTKIAAVIELKREIGGVFKLYGVVKPISKVQNYYKLCEIPNDVIRCFVKDLDVHFHIFDENHDLATLNIVKKEDKYALFILDELESGIEFHFDFATIL